MTGGHVAPSSIVSCFTLLASSAHEALQPSIPSRIAAGQADLNQQLPGRPIVDVAGGNQQIVASGLY
jgi:hypothetical protein